MNDLNERITRFENMTDADPENDMAHFSLGQAYLEAGRAAEAAASFEQAVQLNPDMSKAYQLAGDAMIRAGWTDKAVDVLSRGFEVAASKGDQMPKNAIAELLESIGRTPPALSTDVEQQAAKVASGEVFVCKRTGRPGTKLDEPPIRGPVGEWIQAHISAETWRDWIGQGTKVINELRLDFSREEDQQTYEKYMYEFLGIDDALRAQLTGQTTEEHSNA